MAEKNHPKQPVHYGEWPSPITAQMVANAATSHSQIQALSDAIYWVETLPEENNRCVIVCQRLNQGRPSGEPDILTPTEFNVRSQVHEYGGGAYLVAHTQESKTVYFCNFADQRVYKQNLKGGAPTPLTPEGPYRYADFCIDSKRQRLFAVRENFTRVEKHLSQYPENEIVIIDTETGDTDVLIKGADFFSNPRISPNGKKLCWLCWNHPQMPWDGTECWVAELNEEGIPISGAKAAGSSEESVFQPQWSPDNVLHFVSDKNGWWNLYRRVDSQDAEALYTMEAEFGRPQWVFGQSCYDFDGSNKGNIVCCFNQAGYWRLAKLEPGNDPGTENPYKLLCYKDTFADIGYLKTSGDQCVFVAAFADKAAEILLVNVDSQKPAALKKASPLPMSSGYLSPPQGLTFTTTDGSEVHGFYYPPTNKDHPTPANHPPAIIKSHGGPSSATSSALDFSLQFWTSRGFAVFDINYRGSTGFGRTFREKLKGGWGKVDVEDCIAAAEYLVSIEKADKNRLIIRGSSAGGYTTLSALTFSNTFKAGASYYGISDIKALAEDCHKFESHYVQNLLGPLPEQEALYFERSPLHFPEQLSCPVIFFQGAKDHVVPRNQARKMVSVLKEKQLPVAYVEFEQEAHGFRLTANIIQALENELYFYRRVLNLKNLERLKKVEIYNLAAITD